MLRRIFIYVALVLTARSIALADSSTVLAFPFENQSNDRTLDWIGEGISELINERFQPESGVEILSGEERIAIYDKIGIPEGNDRRLARRARGQSLNSWLDEVQSDMDFYLFGDALRELHDVVRIFPDSTEARSLLAEVDRQRNLK